MFPTHLQCLKTCAKKSLDKALDDYGKKLDDIFEKTIIADYADQVIDKDVLKKRFPKEWQAKINDIKERNLKVQKQRTDLNLFYDRVVPKVLDYFKKMYLDVTKTCSCWNIIHRQGVTEDERKYYFDILKSSCSD